MGLEKRDGGRGGGDYDEHRDLKWLPVPHEELFIYCLTQVEAFQLNRK